MNNTENTLNIILVNIANELNISPAKRQKAVDSYDAVGKWIGDGFEENCIHVFPQGSMNLGTVVRPLTSEGDDDDGYDIDLVCLIEDGSFLELADIKNNIGDRLKENATYRKKLNKEGKRCWTLNYAGFHMDILPCVPKGEKYDKLEQTSIKLTHKNEQNQYEARYSDPYKYGDWFRDQMKQVLLEEKGQYAFRNQIEIDDVPEYMVRTPLQQAVQLLKRHRDIYFQSDDENAPISIIITTLAAKAYDNEKNLYTALNNIVIKMPRFIVKNENGYEILNPVMAEENFADKWNENPLKVEAFNDWLRAVRRDIFDCDFAGFGLENLSQHLSQVFGKLPVNRAFLEFGDTIQTDRVAGELGFNNLNEGIIRIQKSSGENVTRKIPDHTFFGA